MAGHVFVVQSDLTQLHCDGWLLPTDGSLIVEDEWFDAAGGPPACAERLGERRWRLRLPGAFRGGARVHELDDGWRENAPRAWLTDVGGGVGSPSAWYVEGVAQFVRAAAKEGVRRTRRPRPLLALPLVGTGKGGKWSRKAEMVTALLRGLKERADQHDVDLVLVTHDPRAFAAVQDARRRVLRSGAFAELSAELRKQARRLAKIAMRGELTLFLGAGVSQGADLPGWDQLLHRLAVRAELDEIELKDFANLDALDRGRIVERRLGGRKALGRAVVKELASEPFSVSHALLANLGTQATVTLNYDRLFERACRAAHDAVTVMPGSRRPRKRWLLKLHGCLRRPSEIVLTREDYLRYRDRRIAQAGVVQALLLTSHVLFVGFGLKDPNFHEILDDVRKGLGRREGLGRRGGSAARENVLGTALVPSAGTLQELLWKDDLHILPMADPSVELGLAFRTLEIFLDHLCFLTSRRPAYLFDRTYEDLLSSEERGFRDEIEDIAKRFEGRLAGSPARTHFDRLLQDLGRGRT